MIERVGETPGDNFVLYFRTETTKEHICMTLGKTHLTFCQVFMQTTFRTACQDKLAFDFRKMAAGTSLLVGAK